MGSLTYSAGHTSGSYWMGCSEGSVVSHAPSGPGFGG